MRAAGSRSPIRVLLVEDSPSQRALLVGLLQSSTEFVVAGTASTGIDAIAAAQRLRPDIIAMDIMLPAGDGFQAARQIMQQCPTRIVLVTSDSEATQRTPEALAVGALTVIRKPGSIELDTHATERAAFLTTLRLMAGVPVVTRHSPRVPLPSTIAGRAGQPQVLAIAASTGGPLAVQTLLRGLGAQFPLPVLVVQHITRGYTSALATWLKNTVPLPVQVAASNVALESGHVYIAPDEHHLVVPARGIIGLRPMAKNDSFCPSADMLFTSLAASYGNHAIGVVLTGMGDDGTRGMQALSAAGSPTFAQDEASCVVYGMPRAAVAAGAITRVAPLQELGSLIRSVAGSAMPISYEQEST